MNILLRSFVAAGALTLLGAAYVDGPRVLGVASAAPSATFNLDGPDPFGAIAMQTTASATAVDASTSSQDALPRSSGSAAAPAVASRPLFLGDATLSPRALAVAKQIADLPETSDLKVMDINPAAVAAQTREIALDLGTRRVNLVQEQAQGNADGSLTWMHGHVKETSKPRPRVGNETPHDALNSAILTRRGNGVTGSVRMAGKLFRIRPLPGGAHAVVEVDESRRPADHPQS